MDGEEPLHPICQAQLAAAEAELEELAATLWELGHEADLPACTIADIAPFLELLGRRDDL